MLLRRTLTVLFTALSLPAAAECVGVNYLDQLSPAQSAALSDAVADLPYGEGIIWEARKDDRVITIAGTMHIFDQRLEPIRASLEDTVTSADLILLEATPKEEQQLQDMMAKDPGRLFITEGPTLPDLLDEATWLQIADAARSRGIPAFMAAKMQPWYLSMVLSIPACATAELMAGSRGLDAMIIEDALSADVPMKALEPYTTLFDIFQNDTVEEQIAFLRVNLGAPDMQDQIFVATLDRYFARDVGRLWEMSRIVLSDVPGLTNQEAKELFAETEQTLLIDRNLSWMPVINDAATNHDRIVIAVGAAHLVGSFGVLQLLENEGWTLTRID